MQHVTGDINGKFNYHNVKHINTLLHIVEMYLPEAWPLRNLTAPGRRRALYATPSTSIT